MIQAFGCCDSASQMDDGEGFDEYHCGRRLSAGQDKDRDDVHVWICSANESGDFNIERVSEPRLRQMRNLFERDSYTFILSFGVCESAC